MQYVFIQGGLHMVGYHKAPEEEFASWLVLSSCWHSTCPWVRSCRRTGTAGCRRSCRRTWWPSTGSLQMFNLENKYLFWDVNCFHTHLFRKPCNPYWFCTIFSWRFWIKLNFPAIKHCLMAAGGPRPLIAFPAALCTPPRGRPYQGVRNFCLIGGGVGGSSMILRTPNRAQLHTAFLSNQQNQHGP